MAEMKQLRNKRKLTAMQRHQERMSYLFITPALIMFFTFVLLPIVMSVYLSLFSYGVNMSDRTFVGFDYFVQLFTFEGDGGMSMTSLYWDSFLDVLKYTAIQVPAVVVLSLLFAVLVNQKLPGAQAYRIMYYIPSITSGVAAAYVFQFIFSNAEYGVMNSLLKWFGVEKIGWLKEENLAILVIAIVSVWGGIGGNMIIYLASLQGVSPDLLEAASIDGATKWQSFYHITLPQIANATYFIVMMSLIGSFQLYDQVDIILGSNNHLVSTPVARIYYVSFDAHIFGLGNAMAILLFAVIMVVTSINNFIQNKINERFE